ncbi:restriction endonuclease subunit S [Acinetobacter baumannii]|uniref:restriction endonuclease subunit S n=1 Tax=Acinetobacter baumannii TaxID=470 RepID=UPI003891E484
MESNTILYKPLGDVIELLTDYHANGAYEKLKENVTLLDKENHAVMIRTTNFEANDFTNNLIYIDEHAYEFLKKSKVYASDLIMNKIANPGTVYFMPEISKPVSLGMNLFLIRINPKKANPYFIYAYLRKNEHYVKSFASGSTTKTITKDDVRRLKIYTPPLAEQNKIAQILSIWDQAISATEKLLENSQQQKKALMQQLLTGKKRLLDENGVKFSEEWKKGKLNDLVKIDSGFAFKSSDFTNSFDGVPIIRMSDFKNGGLDIREAAKVSKEITNSLQRFRLNSGDFVFGMSGSLSNYGWVKEKDLPCYLNQRVGRLVANEQGDQKFVTYLYLSEKVQQSIIDKAAGAAQLNISVNDLRGIQVFYPVKEEQQKIAKVLSLADQEIENLYKKIDCLKQEKKALMQQLLTGKKRVKVAA